MHIHIYHYIPATLSFANMYIYIYIILHKFIINTWGPKMNPILTSILTSSVHQESWKIPLIDVQN